MNTDINTIIDISNVVVDISDNSEVTNETRLTIDTPFNNIDKELVLDNENESNFFDKFNDQDFKQKMNSLLILLFELYRVLMGSFIVLLVPQECDNNTVCSLDDNLNKNDDLFKTGLSMNMITFLLFLLMYAFETKRENKLITYLEVNKFEEFDNDNIGDKLQFLSQDRCEKLWKLDMYYKYSGLVSLGSFSINSVISGIIVYDNYYDTKTTTVFITNVLFMALKLYDVYSIVNTKKNIFYSAYLKNHVQYNDVDPDKRLDTVK